MQYYPVYLDMNGRNALIIGGGVVGSRKAKTLLRAGARVTVVSPQGTEAIRALADEGRLIWHKRGYHSGDMQDKFLVFSATDDPALNRRVEEDAARYHVLCNYADQPERGQFILPSIVQRGDLLISISTSGKSPAVARRLRKELERYFGEEYAPFLRLLGAIRERLLEQAHAPDDHRKVFNRLIDAGLLAMVKDGNIEGINRLLATVLGEDLDAGPMMGPR